MSVINGQNSFLSKFPTLPSLPRALPTACATAAGAICYSAFQGLQSYCFSSDDKNSSYRLPILVGLVAAGGVFHLANRILNRAAYPEADKKMRQLHVCPDLARFDIVSDEDQASIDSRLSRYDARDLLVQAFAIRNIYRETHYTFTSAQAVRLMPITLLLQMLHEKSCQIDDPALFQLVGNPNAKPPYTIDKYRLAPNVMDSEPNTRKDLISADVYLLSEAASESTIYFLGGNVSDLPPYAMKDFIKEIIKDWKPDIDLKTIEPEINALEQLARKLEKDPLIKCGNLFVISIPKEMAKDSVYYAHGYGTACSVQPDLDRIQELQDGTWGRLPCKPPCKRAGLIPQARIFRPSLNTPKNGIRIALLTALNTGRQTAITTEVRQIKDSILAKCGATWI